MGDISNSTGKRRFRAVAGTLAGFAGALAVAASALAYTLFGVSEEAPFLSAGAQPVRTTATPSVAAAAALSSEVATPAPPAVSTPAPAEPSDATAATLPPVDAPPATPPPSQPAASTFAPVAPIAALRPSTLEASVAPVATPAIAPSRASASAPPAPAATSTPLPVAAVPLSGREQGLVDAMNSRRSAAGIPPLLVSAPLTGVARARSSDMLANNYFAHASPSGQTWYGLLTSFGMSYSAGGENLAKVSGDTASSVVLAIEAFMASPTHRANILNPAYRLVGVGGAVQGDTLTILTSVFTDR